MSEDQSRFMQEVIELSVDNVKTGKGGPFAAVVVKDGKIIARGTNEVTTDNDPTAHAEVVAIRKACEVLNSFQLEGCEIYTSCEPCPMCLGAIYWARPDKVYFAATQGDAAAVGFDDSFIYKEIARPYQERTIPMLQLMQEEAIRAFKAWEAAEDKIKY